MNAYWKNPETYLNNKGWEYEIISSEQQDKPVKINTGDPLPKDYGIRSKTATQMPDSLRKRIKNIGQ